MAVVATSGMGGGTGEEVASTAKTTTNLNLPEVSGWFLPAAIGLVILIAATWNTKARAYVVGFSVLVLVGIVLQWGPSIEPQVTSLIESLKPASGSTK
jgi:hypothetical protein